MEAFDALPADCRSFIQNLDFNLLDAHILAGEAEVRRVKHYLDTGGGVTYYETGKN